MSCVDCDDCKADLARYLTNPRKYITSAASDAPTSLDNLRTVIYNSGHTPAQHVKPLLDMLFNHLSAGDQSRFEPVGPLPSHLKSFESKALLSLAGLSAFLEKFVRLEGVDASPVKRLVKNWHRIRNWTQHFLYRVLQRTAPPSSAPLTADELKFFKLGEDWSIVNMIFAVLTFVREDKKFFDTTLTADGTFTLCMKLWSKMVRERSPPTPEREYRSATLLLADYLQHLHNSSGNLEDVRAQLVKEFGGDTKKVAAFLIKPLRDAAKMTLIEFASQISILGPTLRLIQSLIEGNNGGVRARPVFGLVFSEDSKLNPRPFMAKILTKYTALCDGGYLAPVLREVIKLSFKLCASLLMYREAISFAVKLLDNGLLEAYANLVSNLHSFTEEETYSAAFLLKQRIGIYLSHEDVITASKKALHRLEKERNTEFLALKNKPSGVQDAWKHFFGHTFERAILKGLYDAKFKKEDKLTCDSCSVRMSEKTLKKCSACKVTLYCSKECQTKSWSAHKQRCRALARNLEVHKMNADTTHFTDYLVRSDVRRHIPGLTALVERDPIMRDGTAPIAYLLDYTFAPTIFSPFPAEDVSNDSKYVALGVATNPQSQAVRHNIVERVRETNGLARILQVEMRRDAGTPVAIFTYIGMSDFSMCPPPPEVHKVFNQERPRGIDERRKALAVQCDLIDVLMFDAIHGRTLTEDEIVAYMMGDTHLAKLNQSKTLFERIDEAVRRRLEMKERLPEFVCLDLVDR